MARIRSIHPNACTSEKLARATAQAERCYWRLQTHCDDDGRCEDHPRLIWAALFPLHESITPEDVDGWLEELHDLGLVVRYHADGKRILCVWDWALYQHPQRPTRSKLSPPRESEEPHPRVVREQSAMDLGDVPAGEGEGEGGGDARKRAVRPPKDFQPTDSHRGFALEHGLDCGRECERWINDCEAKGRVYKSLNAGFRTWLDHAVDFGRGSKSPPVTAKPDAPRPDLSPWDCPLGNDDCHNGNVLGEDGRTRRCGCNGKRVAAVTA